MKSKDLNFSSELRGGFNRVLATAVLGGVIAVGSAPLVLAEDNPAAVNVVQTLNAPESQQLSVKGRESVDRLGSCISNKKKADLLFVVDESASLRGHNGPATDPENIRVDAATYLMRSLGKTAKDYGASINVKVAGFGEVYNSEPSVYGDWVDVGNNPDALEKAIGGFSERNDQLYTDYASALEAASAELSNHSEPNTCRSILLFTDGKLTVPGDKRADEQALSRICSPAGLIDRLRASGIQLFTVGLVPESGGSPEELLRGMAETTTCGANSNANGAFFNAKNNPASLFRAFRGILPQVGSAYFRGTTDESFKFYLDDSISDVRLSVQPEQRIKGRTIIPTLTSPDGKTIELTGENGRLGATKLEVLLGSGLPGMVDVDMFKQPGESWEGEWVFKYRLDAGDPINYSAQLQILPGLHFQVDELKDGSAAGLSNDQKIHARLLNKHGEVQRLEGIADLEAEFVTGDGTRYQLLDATSIRNGGPIEIPLSAVDKPASGELVLKTSITTAGPKDKPGTLLTPLVARFPISITPLDMPRVAGAVDFSMKEKETIVDIPVQGPGELWLREPTGKSATYPQKAENFRVSSVYSGRDSAMKLREGESALFPVKITVDRLADGPVALHPVIGLNNKDRDKQAEVDVALTGTMRAPVNKTVFFLTFLAAFLLGLIIPLMVLYLARYLTGTITKKPIDAISLPVTVKNGRVNRQGENHRLDLGYREFIRDTKPINQSRRKFRVDEKSFRVRYGWNPLTKPVVIASQTPSSSNTTAANKSCAELPLELNGSWVLFPHGTDGTDGEVVLFCDRYFGARDLEDKIAEICGKVPPALQYLNDVKEPSSTDRGHDRATSQRPKERVERNRTETRPSRSSRPHSRRNHRLRDD